MLRSSCRQFAARRPAIAHQRRGRYRSAGLSGSCVAARQTTMHPQAIFGVTRQGIRKSGRLPSAGNGLLPGFFCAAPAWSVPAGSNTQHIRHAGDFAAEFHRRLARWNVCVRPKRSTSPVSTQVRRQRRRQHLIRFRHPLTPAEQPPRPLRLFRQITDADLSGVLPAAPAQSAADRETSSSFATPPRTSHSDSLRL